MKKLVIFFMLVTFWLTNASVASAAEEHQHRLFMKEFASYAQGILDKEDKIRSKVRDQLRTRSGSYRMTSQGVSDVFSYAYDGFLCSSKENDTVSSFAQKELNKSENKDFNSIARGLTFWIYSLMGEETAKGPIGKIDSSKVEKIADERKIYEQSVKSQINVYLSIELTQQDMEGQSFTELLCDQ